MPIPATENQHVEFKLENVAPRDLAEEIVAFANADGGEIWLGVDDRGQPVGIAKSYEEDVMNLCRTAVIPPLTPEYAEQIVAPHGVRVACIRVPKGLDRPYYTNRNRYFIRAGSTKRTASREELMRLFQNAGLYHYDIVELQQAVRGQLNLSQIAAYFERYQIEFATESAEEQERLLQALDVLGAQGHPTVGGLLVFGLQPERLLPQSGVAFAVFAGTELGADLRDKKTFLGPLPQQIDLTLAAIKANLPVPSTIEGTQRIEAPHYPDKVFRELLVNACVHRNYSITGSRIRVFLFDDRLEVISPGRLPNTVSIKKLTVGTSYARNPMLVRLLENLGYVDHLGRGLPMVYQAAKRLQRTVHFEESAEEFRVTLML